jgi:glutathione S-transferase
MTMKLIGQYDSPFTRRVGITMKLYGLSFEHSTWSVFGNADELGKINPLIRVPTLVLDTGEALIETAAIIDYLDSLVPAQRRLLSQTQPDRYRVLQAVSLASGISDMAIRLFYEQRLHNEPSPVYVERLTRQITQTLAALEQQPLRSGSLSQADIAITCMYRHLSECHPSITVKGLYPILEKHCAAHEMTQVFMDISQAFIAPA